MKIKCLGTIQDITFKYNSFVNEEIDKRKSQNGSKGEIIDNNFLKNRIISNTDSESTTDSNRPLYIEKYEKCTEIFTNLEKQCI